MDFNDLDLRIRRVYNSVGKQIEDDVAGNIRVNETFDGKQGKIEMRFGNHSDAELANRVFEIIGLIAGFQDHLTNKMLKTSGGVEKVKKMVNGSDELKIVIDLCNQEKHGLPLTHKRRYDKETRIENIRQALTMEAGQGPMSFIFSFPTGFMRTRGAKPLIRITADVVDQNGNIIMTFDKLVKDSLQLIEEFIKNNNLKG